LLLKSVSATKEIHIPIKFINMGFGNPWVCWEKWKIFIYKM